MQSVHASCVALDQHGILILGPSGSGKSDLVLRLIDEGAHLIADDQVILTIENQRLYATAPSSLQGLLEIWGYGIISVSYKDRIALSFALALETGKNMIRLPEPAFYTPFPSQENTVQLPKITLDPWHISTTAKIRAIMRNYQKG